MTRSNVIPVVLLVLFLATVTPQVGLQLVLVTLSDVSDRMEDLSDAFESLHLHQLAEDARSSLLKLAERTDVVVEAVRVRLERKLNRALSEALFAQRPGPAQYE